METSTAVLCRHHWIIETPNGPESAGACKHCGAARMFQNGYDLDRFDPADLHDAIVGRREAREW